ncbi:beta-glucuronidase [Asticcacaulis sp. AC460]|uniref:glycoside hydrolase family 2 protein n=1 Tax=Asticcacaulis sp. AC460 TaxID=1282360 RepID=UPI0003C3CAD7|nr:glycoside hydrolase family 2 TIM barrel-domain containing protein [Asticcacaulis sp. AC460]ESQ91164.1 beta-glucuronidase [Asticcacaulis sp. AC460]
MKVLKQWVLAFVMATAPLTAPMAALANPAAPADNAAYAEVTPQYILVSADMRAGMSLSGPWHWSVDPYRDGLYDFHGKPYDPTKGRAMDISVADAMARNPNALFEHDLHRAPVTQVPGSWIGYDPETRYYDGLMWYLKSFDAPVRTGKRVFLRFGAADYRADVYLNGQKVGSHEGGFTPFSFDVTDILRDKGNNLIVAVDSKRSADTVPPTVTDWETYGGITRDVRLVVTPQTYVDDDFIRLTKDGRIAADVALEGAGKSGQAVEVAIPALKLTLKGTTDGNGRVSLSAAAPKSLKRWSPETPVLYDVMVKAGDDILPDRIGFRTIEVRGTDILLNGQPIYLRGISLHEEEFGTSPQRIITQSAARALLGEIKYGLNGNYVRLSHYPHSEVMTRMADEMGLLVWSEIPVYWTVKFESPEVLKAAQRMQAENILRDRNRASIIIWSIGNETPVSDARNSFYTAMARHARAIDGSRLISAALLTERKIVDGHIDMTIDDPIVPELDVMGVNTYNGWYGNDKIADVPNTVWHSASGKPLLLSEFGADAQFGNADPERHSRFSEDYQVDFYNGTLAMADKIPFLRGMSPWILKDFRSPRRQTIWQEGWNRKGLVSETGQRKRAFFVLSDYYKKKAAE